MGATALRSGLSRPTIRFQPTKSRLHFCFVAENAAAVDAFHAAALRSGGQDNGAPGLRAIYGPDYYAAFIIDPDGYRIEAYYGPAET
jgi:catechol 2,3-dioxygenase-like lactoylglutathione lyase family enzyme